MNNSILTLDVLQTLIRAVLKIGGGAMIAKGMADNDAVEAIGAGVIAAVAVVWGMFHRQKPKDLLGPQFEDLKELRMFVLIPIVAVAVTGCASANAVAFRTEKLLTDTAYGAVVVWKGYYSMELTNRTPARVGELEKQNAQVYEASRRFAAAMMVADGIRESASTNSAVSNRTALQIALTVGREQSSNVVWLVRSYMAPKGGGL